MKSPWKKLSSKIVHKNPWYYVRQDKVIRPDGKPGTYSVVVTKPSVFIIAANEKGEIAINTQYRYTTGMKSLELPAGNTDGQPALAAAKRELKEETGMTAKKWKKLGSAQSCNGIMTEMMHVFLATDLTQTKEADQWEEGIANTQMIPLKEVLSMIQQGKFTDAQSMAAILLALPYLEK